MAGPTTAVDKKSWALATATEKAGLQTHEKRHCQSLSEFATNCRQVMI
jgi:hypothetical protein